MSRKSRIQAALLGVMQAGRRHAWTLEELHEDLARRGQAADFSSVFRAAEKLAAKGAVRKLLLEDGRARFELGAAHHDHLYCTRCHELVAVPCVIGHGDFAALEQATGVTVHDHQVILNGICRSCREQSGERR